MYNNNAYIGRTMKRKMILHRLYLGIQQLVYRPYYNIAIVALLGMYLIIWKYRNVFLDLKYIPMAIEQTVVCSVSVMLMIAFILLLVLCIEKIGELSARRDEARLIVAFKPSDLKHGFPILISRRKMRSADNVTIREFYTCIPKKRWEEMQEEIADCMNVTFVAPYIEYGGKQRNKGNRIIIHSVPNRKLKKRGVLYDEKL